MIQEEKQLLLKDICNRSSYGKLFVDYKGNKYTIDTIAPNDYKVDLLNESGFHCDDIYVSIEYIKPYLRSLSSMTEEEFEKLKEYSGLKYDQLELTSYQDGTYKCLDFYLNEVPSDVVILVFDWLNKHRFDYRGLIEKGLALKALDGMYNN